ncbi:unnamed protein product [Nezara viridula]|uniref:Uncharacterized protein n=1 Tax=Nezara viridula TaxID=85310 RepID=A0A9P0MSL2_NEZVI|nr:unnamed protein product [Nezara viridula]
MRTVNNKMQADTALHRENSTTILSSSIDRIRCIELHGRDAIVILMNKLKGKERPSESRTTAIQFRILREDSKQDIQRRKSAVIEIGVEAGMRSYVTHGS